MLEADACCKEQQGVPQNILVGSLLGHLDNQPALVQVCL